jgi:hypothetical protein
MIRTLRLLEVLDDEAMGRLEGFAIPPVLGGGQTVGQAVAEFELTWS